MTRDMQKLTPKARKHSPQLRQLELRLSHLQEEALWYPEVRTRSRRQECDGDGNHSQVAVPWGSSGAGIRSWRQEWMDREIHQRCGSRRRVFRKNHGHFG